MPVEILDTSREHQHRTDMLNAALAIKALQNHHRRETIVDWFETALSDTADGTLAPLDYRIAAANVAVFGFDTEKQSSQTDRRLAHVLGSVLHHVAEITPRHSA